MSRRMFLALLPLAAATTVSAADTTKRLESSAEVFQEVMQIADRAIPQKLLDKSECVIVVPGLKNGAFIIGGNYGRGFAVCRKSENAGWGAPAAVRLEGGSFGLQAGGSEADVVMLVMNRRGADRLSTSKFTIGGQASVAAGPLGRTATAETDAMLTAEILTWSRSRGAFAGVALKGSTLRPDRKVNEELYGQPWGTREIVRSGLEVPKQGEALVRALNKYSSRKTA